QAVIAAHGRMSDAAAQSGPPMLVSVAATVAGQSIYKGDWKHGGVDGAEAERAGLLHRRQELVEEMDRLYDMRRAFHAERLETATLLAVRGRSYQAAAERYRDTVWIQALTNLGFDLGLTVAELLLTGGSA